MHEPVRLLQDTLEGHGFADTTRQLAGCFHGELALNQLFFLRPSARWAKYRTPVKRYYQCGSGTHPGGGIMGASGRLAAREILADWGVPS